jgi:hypothetical protein
VGRRNVPAARERLGYVPGKLPFVFEHKDSHPNTS